LSVIFFELESQIVSFELKKAMIKFFSNNNPGLLKAIHKLNSLQKDIADFTDQDVIMEYVIEKKHRDEFHLVSDEIEKRCATIVCRLCGNDQFVIGQKEYFTAIKCTRCKYELGIHEG
jgi:hypothetical protein